MHLVSSARHWWDCHPLECLNQGVPKGASRLHYWSLGATTSTPQRHEGLQVLQAKWPPPVSEEGPCHGKQSIISLKLNVKLYFHSFLIYLFIFYLCDFSVVFGQITQQVFVAEEWVHDARNEAKLRPSPMLTLKNPWGPANKNRLSCPKSWKWQTKLV